MMNVGMTIELSAELTNPELEQLTQNVCVSLLPDEEHVDNTYRHKGIVAIYQNSQYKKKVRLLVEPAAVSPTYLDDDERLIHKLRKRLQRIFDKRLSLDDFTLTGASITTELDVGKQTLVKAYMAVLRRVGNVKGFTLRSDCLIGRTPTFLHWQGNSNATDLILSQSDRTGVIQAEVRLLKNKAIRAFIRHDDDKAEQIIESTRRAETIFKEVFSWIIPFGDFCKKKLAVDRIRGDVRNASSRRKMLRLLDLIPKKKSLLLGLKASGCRNPRSLLLDFAKIYLSPVTISKRQKITRLDNLYTYL